MIQTRVSVDYKIRECDDHVKFHEQVEFEIRKVCCAGVDFGAIASNPIAGDFGESQSFFDVVNEESGFVGKLRRMVADVHREAK